MVPPPLGPSARRWAVAWYVVSACLDNIRAGLRARWRSNASGEITAGLATDLTRSFKGWRRRPLWVALVLTTLAVPMAATTVVFSIVDAVVLSDVPYPDADRVVGLWSSHDGTLGADSRLSGPKIAAISDRARVFEAVGGVWSRFATLGGDPGPQHVDVGYISAGLLPALGISPALGE